MARVTDVAAFILRLRGPMTAMKLQKLCYYSNGYHMAWEDRQLFPEPFEAWANGPVAPELYRLHRGRYKLAEGEIPGNPDALDFGERESVELVLQALGDFSGHELSLMTHGEQPWILARMRAGVGPLERSTEELRIDEIGEFFDAVVAKAGGFES